MEEHISNKRRRHLKRKALELLDEKETVKLVLEDCLAKIERKETEGNGKNKKKNKRQKIEHNNDDNNEGNTKKKMLLILDVNKVLVYRLKGSSFFTPRPHVHEFLQLMSKHYHLALWTSMQRSSSKKVLKELFHDRNVRLEFTWFQNRCKIIKSIQQQENDEKPSFFKNLRDVWQEYPAYNTSNTILLDDSEEKCVENDSKNCIHPLPFDLSESGEEDKELHPDGRLARYLTSLSNYAEGLDQYILNHGRYTNNL